MGSNGDEITMSEATLRNIIQAMDHNKDGIVHKHEFIAAYSTVYTGYTAKEYQAVWTAIDRDKNGELSLDELASYYGYSLDDLAEEEMSDETILELLEMQTKLAELAMEKEKKLNPPKMPTSNEPSRRGSRLSSRGLGGSSVRGSEEVRKSAGVTLVKLASPINASAAAADPSVVFLQACEFKDADTALAMIEAKTNLRIEDEKGEMPLHKLARAGLIRPTHALLAATPRLQDDANWQDKQGKTPLMFAAEYNHPDIVTVLLDIGSDATLENVNGYTALHLAVSTKSEAAIIALLSHSKVDRKKLIDVPDRSGRTPLHIAAFSENENMTSILIDYGARPLADAYGNKPSALAGKAGRRNSKDRLEALEKASFK